MGEQGDPPQPVRHPPSHPLLHPVLQEPCGRGRREAAGAGVCSIITFPGLGGWFGGSKVRMLGIPNPSQRTDLPAVGVEPGDDGVPGREGVPVRQELVAVALGEGGG